MAGLATRLKSTKIFQGIRKAILNNSFTLTLSQKAYCEHTRSLVAAYYLRGEGLEIGAAFSPLRVPPDVRVRYVDHKSREELAVEYTDVADRLVNVDLVDKSGVLEGVSDESVDFVVANHVIEHSPDPLNSICQWLRVLKPDGILYMSVPDKRFTFDSERAVTCIEHAVCDYQQGPNASIVSDAEDYLRHACRLPEEEIADRAQATVDQGLECHFHVWTASDFLDLLTYCRRELSFPFNIEFCQQHGIEAIIVLRKLPVTE